MKQLIKLALALCFALSLCSCVTDMDPFQGGTGLRANIDGKVYVMIGSPEDTGYVTMGGSPENSFEVSVTLRGRTGNATVQFEMSLNENSALSTGQKYTVSSAILQGDSLSGWIKFNMISSNMVEAEFELSGGRREVKHGFLRLKK